MTFNPIWTTTPNLPPGNIVLIFSGMMALNERKNPNQYEFLCHGESSGPRNHQLEIKVDGNPLPEASNFKEFKFYVLDKNTGNLANTNPIGAYTPSSLDDSAFSHIVDIEKVYGRVLKRRVPLNFTNRITIRNGVIFTNKMSIFEFSLVDSSGTEIMPPRLITAELGINISLADNEIGVLKWFNGGNPPVIQEFDNTNSHKIIFNNDCSDTSTPNLKCIDSDFPLNFDNIIDDPQILKSDLKKFINIMGCDDTPCTATGYGGSSPWEPPPGENP